MLRKERRSQYKCAESSGECRAPVQVTCKLRSDLATGLVSPESRSKLYMWRLGARRRSRRQRGRGGMENDEGAAERAGTVKRRRWRGGKKRPEAPTFFNKNFFTNFRQRNTQLRSTREATSTAAKHPATSTREANDEKIHTWLFNKKKGGGRLVCIINRTKCNTPVPVRAPPPPPVMRPL
jgi:hypothetical protein